MRRNRCAPISFTLLKTDRAAVFGSSGGAVTALAFAQAHPEQVTTVIAHEAPLIALLKDSDRLLARTEDYCATYLAGDVIDAWQKFLGTSSIDVPADVVEQMFGQPRDPRVVADEHFWFAHELRPTVRWRPDPAHLRSLPTRFVIGIGEDSTGQICGRTSRALADALGTEPTTFPGDHTGFVDTPGAFAQQVRAILHQGCATMTRSHEGTRDT